MIVYLHMRQSDGSRDPALAPYYGKVASYHQRVAANEIKHVYVNETMEIPRVLSAVTAAVGRARSLWNLMVNCHGSPGRIALGAGLTVENSRNISALRSYFTPGGTGITIGCCYAAAGQQILGTRQGCIRPQSAADNGITLLMQIARHSGVPVIGGLDEQITWELNGPVLTVQPNGAYSIRMGRTVDFIRQGQSGGSHLCQP